MVTWAIPGEVGDLNNVGPSQKEASHGNSSEQVNSGENSRHTSPRNKPYNTDYSGPTRKQMCAVRAYSLCSFSHFLFPCLECYMVHWWYIQSWCRSTDMGVAITSMKGYQSCSWVNVICLRSSCATVMGFWRRICVTGYAFYFFVIYLIEGQGTCIEWVKKQNTSLLLLLWVAFKRSG